jgi:hypothetical protein
VLIVFGKFMEVENRMEECEWKKVMEGDARSGWKAMRKKWI